MLKLVGSQPTPILKKWQHRDREAVMRQCYRMAPDFSFDIFLFTCVNPCWPRRQPGQSFRFVGPKLLLVVIRVSRLQKHIWLTETMEAKTAGGQARALPSSLATYRAKTQLRQIKGRTTRDLGKCISNQFSLTLGALLATWWIHSFYFWFIHRRTKAEAKDQRCLYVQKYNIQFIIMLRHLRSWNHRIFDIFTC